MVKCRGFNHRERRERRERLVLHFALQNHGSFSLTKLKTIVKRSPLAVKERDSAGHLPIHYACSRGAPLEMVQFLVELYPESLSISNDFKALPVHYACDC